jgi:hypothetical protein
MRPHAIVPGLGGLAKPMTFQCVDCKEVITIEDEKAACLDGPAAASRRSVHQTNTWFWYQSGFRRGGEQ